MIKTLKARGYKNVGVLRFLVQKGDAKATTLAGTLNLDMANRVAIALILQNNGEPPLGILATPTPWPPNSRSEPSDQGGPGQALRRTLSSAWGPSRSRPTPSSPASSSSARI